MNELERMKKYEKQGLTKEEAFDRVMEENYEIERMRVECDLDYHDGFLCH